MKYLIPIVMLLASCTGGMIVISECEPFEVAGLTLCSLQPVDSDDVQTVVDTVESEVSLVYPEVTNLPHHFNEEGITVRFIETDGLAENCTKTGVDRVWQCEHLMDGATIDGHEIILVWRPCLRATALGHELLHVIEWIYLMPEGKSDKDMTQAHSTPGLFWQTYGEASVEWRVYGDLAELDLNSCD